MSSDGRVIHRPLAKMSCARCGYGFHSSLLSPDERDSFYSGSYDLGLRDRDADRQRAMEYADHIAAMLAACTDYPQPGMSILEFGCGTGALINHLAERWAAGASLGIEAASQLAGSAARDARPNVEIREGIAEDIIADGASFDLCISVNVVEHALDPARFLAACAMSVTESGYVVVVCPDGDSAESELLFRDHVSSFSKQSFSMIAAGVGLQLVASRPLSGSQSGFILHLLRRGVACTTDEFRTAVGLSHERESYLSGWQQMEPAVLSALGARPFAIFGLGEFGDLLNAYCPDVVDKAEFFVVDNPPARRAVGREVIATARFARDEFARYDMMLVAAVHPRSWPAITRKLSLDAERLVHPYQFCSLRSKL